MLEAPAGSAVLSEARLGKEIRPSSLKLLPEFSSLLVGTEGFNFLLTTDQGLPQVLGTTCPPSMQASPRRPPTTGLERGREHTAVGILGSHFLKQPNKANYSLGEKLDKKQKGNITTVCYLAQQQAMFI